MILTAASIGLVAARARNGGPWPGALLGTAAVGVAVFMTVALRFSLPNRAAYPLLSLLAAALAWFGATRLEARPEPGRGRAATGRPAATRRPDAGPAATRPSVTRPSVIRPSGSERAGTRGPTRRTVTTGARPVPGERPSRTAGTR